jgi:hypothetical protein
MEIGPDNLLGGRDNPDWLRDKTLQVGLDRTPVNGHVQKAERAVAIRYLRSRRSVGRTSQDDSSSITGNCASIGGGQRHSANNRCARTDGCHGRRRSEHGEYRRH